MIRGVFLSTTGSDEAVFLSPEDHIPDLFLPARKDGRLGGVTVVFPREAEFGEADLGAFRGYLSGIAAGGDNSFSLRAGAIEGSIAGLKVRIVPATRWENAAPSGPVIVDLAFILAAYRDEVRTPYPDLVRKTLALLASRNIDPGRLFPWISDREEIPLERAYLPKLVAEAFRDPAKFRSGLPPKWEALKLGEHLAYLGYYEQAIAHFDLFLKEDPGEPAIHLRIAYMRLVDRDAEGGLRSLHRAYLADPYFIRGYSAAAFACFGRGDLETAERVIRAGLRQEPGFTDLKVGLGRILLAQAKKMLGTDPGEARKRYAEIAALELPPEIEQQLRKGWEEAQAPPASGGGGPPGLPPGHGSGGHGH